jgi:hypothetical protein
MRGLVVFGFHLIGETVFWLKSLYQLGFVRFFGFYFWIGGTQLALLFTKPSVLLMALFFS